jgi:hypothetical protein
VDLYFTRIFFFTSVVDQDRDPVPKMFASAEPDQKTMTGPIQNYPENNLLPLYGTSNFALQK